MGDCKTVINDRGSREKLINLCNDFLITDSAVKNSKKGSASARYVHILEINIYGVDRYTRWYWVKLELRVEICRPGAPRIRRQLLGEYWSTLKLLAASAYLVYARCTLFINKLPIIIIGNKLDVIELAIQ